MLSFTSGKQFEQGHIASIQPRRSWIAAGLQSYKDRSIPLYLYFGICFQRHFESFNCFKGSLLLGGPWFQFLSLRPSAAGFESANARSWNSGIKFQADFSVFTFSYASTAGGLQCPHADFRNIIICPDFLFVLFRSVDLKQANPWIPEGEIPVKVPEIYLNTYSPRNQLNDRVPNLSFTKCLCSFKNFIEFIKIYILKDKIFFILFFILIIG